MADMSPNTQMFVTTSEPPERLREWLGDADNELIDLGDERVLRPLTADEDDEHREEPDHSEADDDSAE